MTEHPRPRVPRGEIDAAIDWTGQPVDCHRCPHRALLEQSGCGPRWSCVQDRYARRIDRFFAMHPALANDYLDHPYFEVRAVAAKYADLFRLPALLADPDETVRWSVAMRLPPRQLHKLSQDPDREVRIRVAARVEVAHLLQMIHDPDYYVRQIIARRLPETHLHLMASDPDSEVRKVVAARGSELLRERLAGDPDPAVRLVAIEYLPADRLFALRADTDWRVRYKLAARLPRTQLWPLLGDKDSEVRKLALARWAEAPDPVDPVPNRG